MSFGISADNTEKDVDYTIDDENFLADFVRFSRSRQVLNEEQALLTMMGLATGMMSDYEFYTSIIVTGSASGGKSHMLNNVIFDSTEYADDVHDWVYELTGGSDQAGINDPAIDNSRILYFHELQKIPDEMLEFIKTIAEDGEFRYGRSQSDPDAQGGFSTEHIERDPAPVIFSFADENTAAAGKDQELRSRTVEVKVDEGPEKNKGVHDMKWGGENITLEESHHEYIFDDPGMEHAVKAHLRDMPEDVDVVIPYGNSKFDGDDWCAADVVKPMFNFDASDSTRASANLAGLTMGSAILNYHARNAVCEKCMAVYGPDDAQSYGYDCPDCDDADLHIIASETDVGNLIACRETLLATTHDLTEKKFAVLDAILERGGQADKSGTAVQATKQDIIDEIQANDEIATLTKSEIESILTELDEKLIINIKDNPQDRRENLYVYDGGDVFTPPDIFQHYDRFESVIDPIRDHPIERTIESQQESLNATMEMDALDGAASGDSGLDGYGGTNPSDLSDDATRVAERLSEQLDGYVVPREVWDANSLKVQHMVGDSPVEHDDGFVRPEREPSGADRVDGFMSPDEWDGADDFNAVESRVEDAIAELRDEGVLHFDDVDDGKKVTVEL